MNWEKTFYFTLFVVSVLYLSYRVLVTPTHKTEAAQAPAKTEFYVRELPVKSPDNFDHVYEVTGHGKTCYVFQEGHGRTTLWCEANAQ